MGSNHSFNSKYALVGLLGAAVGGLIVVVATRAVPRILCRTMAAMMENMAGKWARVEPTHRTYDGG